MSEAQLLDALELTLRRIQALTPPDKAAWDANEVLHR